jgi:hypothetical protein
MAFSGMLRRVALVKTDVLKELSASVIRVTRIGELGTTLAATSNRRSLFLRNVRRLLATASVVPSSPSLVTRMKVAPSSSEMSVLTRATRRNMPEDAVLNTVTLHAACNTRNVVQTGVEVLKQGAIKWINRMFKKNNFYFFCEVIQIFYN